MHTRSQAFLRLAYALTREHTLAEDLLQTTLAKVWPVWKRISGDPEPYVRRALVNTYNSWWRRRWNGEHPTGDLPERSVPSPESLVDDRDEVWRALARLPKRQRAVLVLRYFEDLSEAEIASTLDMAPGTVKSYAAKGLATLRADPAILSVPAAPAATERLAAVRERVKHRRRAIVATTAAVIAIIVMLLLTGSPFLRRQTLPPIEPLPIPKYYEGTRIVSTKRVLLRDGGGFTFVSTGAGYRMFVRCGGNSGVTARWLIEINEDDNIASCDGNDNSWDITLRLGQTLPAGTPVNVIITAFPTVEDREARTQAGQGDFGDGWIEVALGQEVPFTAFPLPSRPAELATIIKDTSLYNLARINVMQATGPPTVTLTRHDCYTLEAYSQTPGLLHLKVNGKPLHTFEWWNYKAHGIQYPLNKDAFDNGPVTLSVDSEHTTSDWRVYVISCSVPPP